MERSIDMNIYVKFIVAIVSIFPLISLLMLIFSFENEKRFFFFAKIVLVYLAVGSTIIFSLAFFGFI